MAGERKGKAYEAIVHNALTELVDEGHVAGPLHWNVRPDGMSIEPDFSTGRDHNLPATILLLNHSNAAGNSHMKFWRNLGELVEAKTTLQSVPRVYCLTFGIIKEKLEAIQEKAFDAFVWLRDEPWIDQLDGICETLAANESLRTDTYGEAAVEQEGYRSVLRKLKRKLQSMYSTPVRAANRALWDDHRARAVPTTPAARNTFLRRGATKLFLFNDVDEVFDALRTGRPLTSPPEYLLHLGLTVRRAGRVFIAEDRDLQSVGRLLDATSFKRLLEAAPPTEGFLNQVQKLRSLDLLPHYLEWCADHWDELSTTAGMSRVLNAQHVDPEQGLQLPGGVEHPRSVWIMDAIGSILRTASKKSQDFGYSMFAKHRSANRERIGNMGVGTWISCFMNQFFNRLAGFTAPAPALQFVAEVLAEKAVVAAEANVEFEDVRQKFVAKEMEAILMAHRGFDPLWGLIKGAVRSAKKRKYMACFAESAGIRGSGGTCAVSSSCQSIINWQSCTDAGRDHKKKELCGRAISLRYTWDGERFVRRDGANKLILLVDGTWRDADLKALARAGWDEFFYPDEMDELARAIV